MHNQSCTRWSATTSARATLLLLSMLAATGCATVGAPQGTSAPAAEPTATLPPAVARLLEQRTAGTTALVAESPWGKNVMLTLHAPYHAASGRTCRALTVEADGVREPALACQLSEGSWQNVRVLHHVGRPLLSANGESLQRREQP